MKRVVYDRAHKRKDRPWTEAGKPLRMELIAGMAAVKFGGKIL